MKGDAEVIEAIEGVADDLGERVSDWPPATCSWIDAVLKEIAPVAEGADRLEREGEDADRDELIALASDADTLLRQLPDLLEELRSLHDGLRTALHEALESRKSAITALGQLAGQIEVMEDA